MADYVGRIVLVVNGVPVAEAKSVNPREQTGRKVVKGMSPTGLPIGTVDGTPEFTLDCEFYIPKLGELVDWRNLTGAVLIIKPRSGGARIQTWTGCFCIDTALRYSEDGEATRSVTLGALGFLEIAA